MSISWSKQSLTTHAAMAVLQVAIAAAIERGLAASIVVVDEAGNIKASIRMDGASSFTYQAATDKAFTAANSGMPTSIWDGVVNGNAHVAVRLTTAINRLNMLPGGVPITFEGSTIGAVGVSGGTDDQDVEIAESAVSSLDGPGTQPAGG